MDIMDDPFCTNGWSNAHILPNMVSSLVTFMLEFKESVEQVLQGKTTYLAYVLLWKLFLVPNNYCRNCKKQNWLVTTMACCHVPFLCCPTALRGLSSVLMLCCTVTIL